MLELKRLEWLKFVWSQFQTRGRMRSACPNKVSVKFVLSAEK